MHTGGHIPSQRGGLVWDKLGDIWHKLQKNQKPPKGQRAQFCGEGTLTSCFPRPLGEKVAGDTDGGSGSPWVWGWAQPPATTSFPNFLQSVRDSRTPKAGGARTGDPLQSGFGFRVPSPGSRTWLRLCLSWACMEQGARSCSVCRRAPKLGHQAGTRDGGRFLPVTRMQELQLGGGRPGSNR